MIKAAILGYGNIGSGVLTVLERSKELIRNKVGEEVYVKYILDIRDLSGDPYADRVVSDINTIVNDPEIRIVVETMGGTKPAYEFVKACLEAGKHVATSNKELVAKHGAELLAIAGDKSVSFLFEASVGGGIPIIRPLNNCITSDKVCRIAGILNGTTNYMLTKMADEGASYEDVLHEAQELGFAERNPAADVEGHDACRKIAILCSLAYGKQVCFEDIYTEGITAITSEDMQYAAKLGCSIKLVATGYEENGKVYAFVSPRMLPLTHPLSSVNGVINAIVVTGDMMGDLMFYGAGAGKLPTASAVVADVVEAAMNLDRTMMKGWTAEKLELGANDTAANTFFVRVKKQAEADLEGILGSGVIFELDNLTDEVGYVTESMTEAEFAAASEKLGDNLITRIRMA